MATGLPELMKRVRVSISAQRLADATDGDLLQQFAQERDDASFAELVRRHGPSVLAECRRVLADPSTGDDVFQATFLVLARRAGAIRDPDRLGGWLRGVASRIARRARAQTAKRSAIERPLSAAGDPAAAVTSPPASDLKAVLTEELNRLPQTYRDVVVACDVDGRTRRAAAQWLGIPVGTLSNRLSRAHALLGRRLLRRGVTLGVGLSVCSLATAVVPGQLFWLTVTNATTGSVPAKIASLMLEASRPMIPIRTLVVVLSVGAALSLSIFQLAQKARLSAAPRLPATVDWPEPPDPKPIAGEYVMAARYSPDNKYLALAQPKNWEGKGSHKVLLYDCRNWKELFRLTGPTDTCFAVEFSDDGKTLFAACNDGNVYSWETATGKPRPNLTSREDKCTAILGSPDGKYLVTGHHDWGKDEVSPVYMRVWDAATHKMLRKIELGERLLTASLTFTPDGKFVAGGNNNSKVGPKDFSGVIEWDVATGKEHKRYDAVRITPGAFPITHSIAYTPDGKWLIVGGGEAVPVAGAANTTMLHGYLWVFDRDTGKLAKTLIEDRNDYVRRVQLSPDGHQLYASTTTAPRQIIQNGKPVSISFGEIQCWDTANWNPKWTQEDEAGNAHWAMLPSPNGRRLVISNSGGVFLLDAKTGERRGGLVETGAK
jgi:RNA polymerase sigma factor (sigma-70 family)